MKGKRVIAGMLAGLMFIVPIEVRAEEASYDIYRFTDRNNLVVSVPANLPLNYSDGKFSGNDKVLVSGESTSIADYTVEVSVDSVNLEYINENDNTAIANGVITFGTNGVESWDKDEVTSATEKDISVEVSSFPEIEGKYFSTINYTINVNEVLKDDIYFTKTVDDSTMTCEITGLTDAGKAWVISEVTNNTRAVDVIDTIKAAGELKIPETLVLNNKRYTVTSIGANAFLGNTDITSVTMADSITKLGYMVFGECSNLVTCQLSDNITDWGDALVSNADDGGSTFWKCSSLSSVNIPNGVSVIPRSCFGYCTSIKSIELPANNLVLGHQAFVSSGIESIYLPEGTTFGGSVTYTDSLGSQFKDCTSLTTINIPSSVTFIPFSAFYGCTSLGNITLPNSITEIGYLGFGNCTAMTSFVVPDSCEKIYNCAFEVCTGLTSFSLPIDCNLKDMSGSTSYAQFTKCTNIKTVTITAGRTGVGITDGYDRTGTNDKRVPWCCGQSNGTVTVIFNNGVEEIANGTFNNCFTIKSLTFPETITSLASEAFIYTRYVSDVYWNVPSGGSIYYSSFGYLGSYVDTTFHVGDNVTSIHTNLLSSGNGINSYSKYINYIDWGNSQVTSIEAYQFCYCALYKIYIPDTVTTIGTHAFHGCNSLKTISVPSSVESIGYSAFYFCENISDIYWDCYKVTYTGINANYVFASAGDGATIFHFGDSFQNNGITAVPQYLFSSSTINGTGTYSIKLKSIDWGTFRPTSLNSALTMANISELEIPDSITSIPQVELWGVSNLTTLYLPSSVTSIGAAAFGMTDTLTTVYYGESEEYRNANLVISEDLAYGSRDNSYLLNATWVYTETTTFSLRTVEEIELFEEDDIEVIDADLLAGFPELKVLTISKTVKSIEANAFLNNTKLQIVYYNGTQSAWKKISIDSEGNENLLNLEIIFLEEDIDVSTISENTVPELTTEELITEENTTEDTNTEEITIEETSDKEETTIEESSNEESETIDLELQGDAIPIDADNEEPALSSGDLITTLEDESKNKNTVSGNEISN